MYDLIIIGAGPAGLTASIYASCFHLKHLVIGRELGGQMKLAPDILNYSGFEEISGKELTERMVAQVKKRGGEIIVDSVVKISKISNRAIEQSSNQITNNPITQSALPACLRRQAQATSDVAQAGNNPINTSPLPSPLRRENRGEVYFEIETQEEQKYQTKSIILATGTERRKLNVPGEVEYIGRGMHYCAACEKQDYEGKICAVVGGANSAVQAAVQLSQAASKVYIIYRGDTLRGDPIWLSQIEGNKRIEVIYNTVVTEIIGDGSNLTGVRLKSKNNPINTNTTNSSINNPITQSSLPACLRRQAQAGNNPINATMKPFDSVYTEQSRSAQGKQWNNEILPLDKLFVEIGGVPGTVLLIPLGVEMDEGGYIKVNARLATNVAGIFAAGDLVSYGLSIEQISSAVGLGARAAASAFAYVKKEKTPVVWGESQIKR